MDLKILFGFLIYWSLIFLFFGGVLTGDTLFITEGYNTSGSFNSTYSEGELVLDSGSIFGVFDALGIIFGAIGRFIALVFFGFTPVLTGSLQVLFTIWETTLTMFFIGWLINSIWAG